MKSTEELLDLYACRAMAAILGNDGWMRAVKETADKSGMLIATRVADISFIYARGMLAVRDQHLALAEKERQERSKPAKRPENSGIGPAGA